MKNCYSLLTGIFLLLVSCGGGDSTPEPPPPVVITPPSAATLIFPDNNTECNEGTVLNQNQSAVTFRWTDAQNADSYELNVRNINTNSNSRTNSSTNSAEVILLRGTPYEWSVVSLASGTNETATSPTWKFYNQGIGIENYAPFPADAVQPARGANLPTTQTVTLEWTATDVDNDLVEFDVYLDTNETPATLLDTTTETTLDVAVVANTVYYWRIVSRDSQGNTSESEIFDFLVN